MVGREKAFINIAKEVAYMKIRHALNVDQRDKLMSIQKNKPPSEKLTQREWLEIMGTNRDIYTRKNGAIRRK